MLRYLNENGVEVRNGFYGANQMKIYKKYVKRKYIFKNSDEISSTLITLPSSSSLKNIEIKYICNLIKNFRPSQTKV